MVAGVAQGDVRDFEAHVICLENFMLMRFDHITGRYPSCGDAFSATEGSYTIMSRDEVLNIRDALRFQIKNMQIMQDSMIH